MPCKLTADSVVHMACLKLLSHRVPRCSESLLSISCTASKVCRRIAIVSLVLLISVDRIACLSSQSVTIPNELLLLIFHEYLDGPWPEHLDLAYMGSPRERRLVAFRKMAGICQTWADLARTVYWTVLDIPSNSQLDALAQLMSSPNPACQPHFTRHITISGPLSGGTSSPGSIELQNEQANRIKSALPIVLHRTAVYATTIELNCGRDIRGYAMLEIVGSFANSFVNVRRLMIPRHPYHIPISRVVQSFRQVQFLELTVGAADSPARMFESAFEGMQLHTVSLLVDFFSDSARPPEDILLMSRWLVTSLAPACLNIRHMRFSLVSRENTPTQVYIDTFELVQTLGSSTITHLDVSLSSLHSPFVDLRSIAEQLAFHSSFPSLLHLKLCDFDLSADSLQRMQCSQLQTLSITMSDKADIGGEKAAKVLVLNILASPVLFNLKHLNLHFSKTISALAATGNHEVWETVEEACNLRGIFCQIYRPFEI